MSVLMVAAVNPSNGSKPYVIMGSDTRKISLNINTNETAVTNDYDKKVLEVNGRLIGVVGQMPDEFLDEYLKVVSLADQNIESLTLDIFELAKEIVSNAKHEGTKLGILLAAIENGYPSLGFIDVDKARLENASFGTETVREGHLITSNFNTYEDLVREINGKVSKNQKFDMVRKYVVSCLKEAAAKKPKTCNQIIDIKKIGI